MPDTVPKLSKREWEALDEIARYTVPFYWRRTSMRKLAARGYVVPVAVDSPRPRREENGPWRITPAGRSALQEASNG